MQAQNSCRILHCCFNGEERRGSKALKEKEKDDLGRGMQALKGAATANGCDAHLLATLLCSLKIMV